MISRNSIGGEMEVFPSMFAESGSDTVWPDFGKGRRVVCDTGRSAFRLALRHWQHGNGGQGRVWLPDYICPSMLESVANEGLSYVSYHNRPGTQALEAAPEPDADDLVVIVHYFGMLNRAALDWLESISRPEWKVLEDCVQAPYSDGTGRIGDYAIMSLRKWWPVPDGAALCLDAEGYAPALDSVDETFVNQRLAAQILRGSGQAEARYLEWIHDSEAVLKHSPPRSCSWVSQQLLSGTDVKPSMQRRCDNWRYIHDRLGEIEAGSIGISPVFDELATGNVPLTYPVRIKGGQRDPLRAWLSRRRIYCPVHWQLDDTASARAKSLAADILSLPIDQRYDLQDMERIIQALKDYAMEYNHGS